MNQLMTLLCIFNFFVIFSQRSKPAYTLFDSKGQKITYSKMIQTLEQGDIILFGELHNNPICHWLQLKVTKDLAKTNQLILGAEMFEQDNQEALNCYLSGEIDNKALDTLARLWKNYQTDYAPLVNFAKEKQFPLIATNIPRRYASKVYHEGFESLDSLSEEEKKWIAPLPIVFDSTVACYANISTLSHGHRGANLAKSQAIKDATMAYFIMKHYTKDNLFIHYNGAYHSDNYEGILWYLKQLNSTLQYKTITTVLQADVSKLAAENKGKADFIICVDEDMTTTY